MAGPSPFKAELVRIALEEHRLFGRFQRGDRPLEDHIEGYVARTGVSATPLVKRHYSAVFVSWCLRSAGASETEFPSAVGHWQYVKFAVQNAESGVGVFWSRRIESYVPQLGDLIHFNRNGGKVDYDWVCNRSSSYDGESGIVVTRDHDSAAVVIGNLEPGGRIGIGRIALTDAGYVAQRNIDPFICLVEVGK